MFWAFFLVFFPGTTVRILFKKYKCLHTAETERVSATISFVFSVILHQGSIIIMHQSLEQPQICSAMYRFPSINP